MRSIGSTIATEHTYDQIIFCPNTNGNCWTSRAGVFDFDGAVSEKLWRTACKGQFFAWLRYHLSDHRPLWAEFRK